VARAAAAGDPQVASILWDRFSPLVRGLLRRSLGPGADVEDQVQDVFLRFFSDIDNLREPSKVRSFLVGITIHVARSELRRRRVRRWLMLSDTGTLPDGEAAPRDDDAREALRRLYAILDDFDAQSRLAFVLRHIEGLELTEVAVGLGLSLATTKRRLAKVVARISSKVAQDLVLRAYLDTTQGGLHAPSQT